VRDGEEVTTFKGVVTLYLLFMTVSGVTVTVRRDPFRLCVNVFYIYLILRKRNVLSFIYNQL
jgi:hypothetical protein